MAPSTTAAESPASLTAESKQKGDEGIRSAMDAAALARALRDISLSRLAFQQSLGPVLPSTDPTLLLGVPPVTLARATSGDDDAAQPEHRVIDTHNVQLLRETLADVASAEVAEHTAQLAIDVPDATLRAAAGDLLTWVRQLRPAQPLSYEAAVALVSALAAPELQHVTVLNLSHVVCPTAQPAPAPQTLLHTIATLRTRYPLPTKPDTQDDDDDDNDEDEAAPRHNAELQARCERLQLAHATDYERALQSLAEYEMNVFALLCEYVRTDCGLRVLRLDHNALGAPQPESAPNAGLLDLTPLRALAKMIDANESLQLLDLSHNELGANGVGVVAKALTKNIALRVVDLSVNRLAGEPLTEVEDPMYEGDDAVFGEPRSGLDALSEVLKKNKFLRVLRLAGNGLHAGDDLTTTTPPEEDIVRDFSPDTDGVLTERACTKEDACTPHVLLGPALQEVMEGWEETPWWRFVQPLQQFHRLRVLDLANNQLRVTGTRMLATALASNRALRVLDLTNNEIGFRGLHYLANLVLRSPCSVLHTLILRRNGLAGRRTSRAQHKAALSAMQAFARAMKGNHTLRRLLLSSNHLGPTLSAALLSELAEATALEELDFDLNDACGEHAASFDPAAAHAVAALLYAVDPDGRSRCALRVLRFAGNNLRAQGLEILCPATHHALPASLHSLYLARNELGHGTLAPLAATLRGSPGLTSLDLAYNAIASTAELLHGLRQHPSLSYVDLSHNKLGSVASHETSELVTALASMPALARLDLSWNDLLEGHAAMLVRGLGHDVGAPALRWLDVRYNPRLSCAVVGSMLRAIGPRAGLQVLYLPSPSAAQMAAEGAAQTLLHEMDAVVQGSETLLDISCGLPSRGTVALDEAEETTSGKLTGQMRRRLLLNALIANCNANKSS